MTICFDAVSYPLPLPLFLFPILPCLPIPARSLSLSILLSDLTLVAFSLVSHPFLRPVSPIS